MWNDGKEKEGKNKKNGKDFSKLFGFAPPEAIDLLKKFFIFDPEKRITV